mmetsp:Transcript_38937/g.59179  ORF Transcript_38937/g.59179 Transcript_38937/m.59179 type:complete len:218 (+) Transcript_38937:1381-2034(+)
MKERAARQLAQILLAVDAPLLVLIQRGHLVVLDDLQQQLRVDVRLDALGLQRLPFGAFVLHQEDAHLLEAVHSELLLVDVFLVQEGEPLGQASQAVAKEQQGRVQHRLVLGDQYDAGVGFLLRLPEDASDMVFVHVEVGHHVLVNTVEHPLFASFSDGVEPAADPGQLFADDLLLLLEAELLSFEVLFDVGCLKNFSLVGLGGLRKVRFSSDCCLGL